VSLDITLHNRTEPCPHCGHQPDSAVYSANITHNLTTMASHAGLYEAVWHPDEHGYTTAGQIIPVLEQGIQRLQADPEHFRQYEPENKWGTYRDFLPWLERYLQACRENPAAEIEVCG